MSDTRTIQQLRDDNAKLLKAADQLRFEVNQLKPYVEVWRVEKGKLMDEIIARRKWQECCERLYNALSGAKSAQFFDKKCYDAIAAYEQLVKGETK